MKRISLSLIAIISAFACFAAPAISTPIEITLADGTTQQVYLRGDEHFHYYESLDGVPMLLQNGKLIADNMLPEKASNKRRAARIAQAQAATSAYPTTGSPRSLVILVNYSDVKFTTPNANEAFTNLLNQSGYDGNGACGSARDYFIASSDSLFQPQFDVYGPYDLPNTMKYYGEHKSEEQGDANAPQMIADACYAAEQAGVDFSLYDTDNNGVIDNVFVYYAGNNPAEGGSEHAVWPHRSWLNSDNQYGGKRVLDYACTSEFRGTGTTMCGIGTFCHEFSHVLGLADLYDTSGGGKSTVGAWDLMSAGNYNGNGMTPPSYTAFERFSLGWLQPQVLTDAGRYILRPLLTDNQAYLLVPEGKNILPNTNGEYFLFENRQSVGWDSVPTALPGEGMLVWHVNYKASLWSANMPNAGNNLCCFIETATGKRRTNGSANDPFPGTRNVTSFNPTWMDGTLANKPILDIQEVGTDITFVFIQKGNKYLQFDPATPVYLNSTFFIDSSNVAYRTMPVETIRLKGGTLDPNRPVELMTSHKDFQISLDSAYWSKSELVTPNTDSLLDTKIFVRYRPMQQACDYVAATLVAQQGAAMNSIELQGKASRPVLITIPEDIAAADVTPYSTYLQWAQIPDATNYYLTMYQLTDGTTSTLQSFEDFDSPTNVTAAGWQTNFNRLSPLLKNDGSVSLYFTNTGESMTSETYVQPITEISFWYSVPSTDSDTVGHLHVEAFNGTDWTTLDNILIAKHDRKKTFTATFPLEANYMQFRVTFTAKEGSNGVCIDSFIAHCEKQINYLYEGHEIIVSPNSEPMMRVYIEGLTPNNEYFYKLQVSDRYQPGCEEHILSMDKPRSFRTLVGNNDETDLTYGVDSIHYNRVERVIYVPAAEGDRTLYFYSVDGLLIGQVAVAAQQNRVAFPDGNFIPGRMYIVKYAVTDSLKRKDRRIKIIY